ncbi:hypothetical protein COU53_02200 [Candidatus Pacearchaeota archaeon CG10_big_fil_rev_8_21_14_0_10_30_48]|nr:MAG: hypothetical protein COU53_02200 [Candidatus Pacearchaeota archaeon CG10_big_fil_rev_8_21_14_0_10_30_48]
MVLEEVVMQFPELEISILNLIKILQIVGGIIGLYLILWIINFFINLKRVKLLKNLETKIDVIDQKLNKLSKK